MSASLSWIAWCSAIGLPIVSRSCGVLERGVECGPGHADRTRRDVDATDFERTEDVAEPAAFFAEQRVGGNAMAVV